MAIGTRKHDITIRALFDFWQSVKKHSLVSFTTADVKQMLSSMEAALYACNGQKNAYEGKRSVREKIVAAISDLGISEKMRFDAVFELWGPQWVKALGFCDSFKYAVPLFEDIVCPESKKGNKNDKGKAN